jgi:hypothetical protein
MAHQNREAQHHDSLVSVKNSYVECIVYSVPEKLTVGLLSAFSLIVDSVCYDLCKTVSARKVRLRKSDVGMKELSVICFGHLILLCSN